MSTRAEMNDANVAFLGLGFGILALIVSRVTEIPFEIAIVGAVAILFIAIALD